MTLALSGTVSNYYKDSDAPAASYTSIGATIALGQLILNSSNGDLYICTDASDQSALIWKLLCNQSQVTTYQAQADWTQASSAAPSFVKNKPSLATVATSGSYTDLSNKPTIPAAQVNSDWNAISGLAQILNKPTIPAAQVNSDWNSSSGLSQIINKPTLATVATTGSYVDLSNKPSIPAAQINSDWNSTSGLAQILNKPTINTQSQSNASGRSLNTAFQVSATQNSMVSYNVNVSCTISLTAGQTGTVSLQIASNAAFTSNVQTIAQFVNGNTGALTLGLNLVQSVTSCLSGFVPAGYYCRLLTANTSGTPTFSYVGGQEALI